MDEQKPQGEIKLSTKQIIGIAGCLITFVGVFMPIVSIPIVGDLNYFGNGEGDGVFLLVLSAISLVFILVKWFKWLWLTGGASLAVICFTFINFRQTMSGAKEDISRDLQDNIFAEIGEAMIDTVQLKWGWAVIVIGIGCILACAALDSMEANARK